MPLPATEAVGYIPAPKSTGPLAQGGTARILLQGSDPSAYDIRDAQAPGGFACPKGQPPPRGYRAFRFLLPGERVPIEIEVATNLVGGCDLTMSPFGS